jgi:signal transduction histidine kinase
MITVFSIRFRIAAWYFLSAAPIILALALGSFFGMRASMYKGIDEELFRRSQGVDQFFQTRGDAAIAELQKELVNGPDLSVGGGLLEVFGLDGTLLFQSPAVAKHNLTRLPKQYTGDKQLFWDSLPQGNRVRFGARRIQARGKTFTIVVAEPLHSFDETLSDFAFVLGVSIPILLLILAGAGFWLSGRAMAPVEQINREARAIKVDNLTSRLSVPKPRDELHTLSQTLNAMLERIEVSVNRLTQFTADASHELRAPLTLIQTAAEYSLRRRRSEEEMVEAMQKVLAEAKRTSTLVDRLMELARSDSGNANLDEIPVDLTMLLKEVVDSISRVARAKKIKLRAVLGDEPALIMGDDAALRELFFNLIDNAVKYTPGSGSVTVALSKSDQTVSVQIADTGIGISEKDIPHVFDRFWRADKVRSRAVGGTGLGLSIAKWIVDQSKGTIKVESTLGLGSRFIVELPLQIAGPT